ncbi:hypothetical protein DFQ27_006629 [Actinomortierella ambigua]|uniref:VOC domain-containing protein n=1 Tax=Actinomortierella ambigua TaxID=1343610 RepID=A0A9P6PV80_9FUNG|nr:hypothetical protein DFQ27_006629 [Actinomortierella ambigua]
MTLKTQQHESFPQTTTTVPQTPEATPDDATVTSGASDSQDGSTFELWNMSVCSQVELPRYILAYSRASFKICEDPTEGACSDMEAPAPRLRHMLSDGSVFELQGVHVMTRYLAKLFDLEGNTARESAMLDMVFTRTTSLVQQWIDMVYSKPNPRSIDHFERFLEDATPAIDALENILAKNVYDGFFCGDETTYPDLAYYAFISLLLDCHPKLSAKVFSPTTHPASDKLYKRLRGDARLATFTLDNPWKYHTCSRVLGLATVGFLSSDIQQSLTFYTDMFGFNCVKKELHATNAKLGRIEFELPNSPATRLSIEASAGIQPRSVDAGQGCFAFNVANVKDLLDYLVEHKVRVLTQPEHHHWGTLARVYDPDNNRITLIDRVIPKP